MIGVKHTRLTAAGNILAADGKLHWLIATNPDSSTRHFTLNDSAAATNEVHKFYVPGQTTKVFSFDPPINFDVGIRISAMEHGDTVVTGGYSAY